MSPALQTLAATLIVLTALGYVSWRGWLAIASSRRKRRGCGPGCGCDGA